MKNKNLLLISSLLLTLSLFSCQSPSSEDNSSNNNKEFAGKTLTIYNCDDYISSGDEDYTDVIKNFEDLYGCKVNYYTYDTNETMYNQFTLAKKGTYDLICTSDYMIQKMVKEKLIEPFTSIKDQVPNYDRFASKAIREKLKAMEVNLDGNIVNLDSYAVGYMWGTLGLIYDASYKDTIQEDIKSWNILWDKNYKDVISLKNSMRDTYVVGLMHNYANNDSKFKNLMEAYLKDDATQEDLESYNSYIQEIFDFKLDGLEESDKENKEKIQTVKEELISVKNNIFGFEVDSGKNDIITGKIKINLAWSGDAVYSIETAMEERGDELTLEYYVPDDGGNIWYDGWTLPVGGQKELACKFLDFISSPENASANMEYVGYTPFIVGDEILDMATSWYGAGSYSSTFEYTYDEENDIQDLCIYDGKLYKCIKSTESGILPTNEEYFESLEYSPTETYFEGDMVSKNSKIYMCIDYEENNGEEVGITNIPLDNQEAWEEVEGYDLSYLFKDSIDESKDAIIYPFMGYQNKLACQYPDQKTIARCGIMNDFGNYNEQVIIMWGQVRAYTNMTPFYIVLLATIILGVSSFTYFITKKHVSARNKRNMQKKTK